MSERHTTDPLPFGTAQPWPAAPQDPTAPVARRRADPLAGLLLVLAGLAAGAGLLLRWLADDDVTGLDLVRRGVDELTASPADLVDSGFWQPLAVAGGGAALFLLGLLVFVPARAHRFLGALALLVTAVVAVAVLVPLGGAGWSLSGFGTGFWLALAVAGLGLLGALKALLTGRSYG
ncbi:hypothetical protein [Geodermatophilus sp. YIM 151500]|uniref:hypothetical protein n=1 Tax=Geodermatophilus sp. YIM 151500 TaxID=2984531 RepID=UPI0021E4611B|nr:hypothetical protein [Geodermatophilus sp. YIM 151500]